MTSYSNHTPWDSRGKNGLYGGGGRGADDKETGWVRGYSIDAAKSIPSQSGGAEEDFFHGEAQEWSNPFARQPQPSNNIPLPSLPPIRRPSYTSNQHLTDSLSIGNRSVTPTSIPSSLSRSTNQPASPSTPHAVPRHPITAPELFVSPTTAGHSDVFSTPPRSSAVWASSPRSDSGSTRSPRLGSLKPKRKNSPSPHAPFISSPLPHRAPPPPHSPLQSQQPMSPLTPRPQENVPRTKQSHTSTFKWSKLKKFPTISNPILSPSFISSLGMETFDITPDSIAEMTAFRRALPPPRVSPSGSKRPRKQLFAVNGSPGAIALAQPEVVSTGLEALRNAGATTPSGSDNEVQDALHRLSHSSAFTAAAPTPPLNPIANHQDFFRAIREERANPVEVQANSPVILPSAFDRQFSPVYSDSTDYRDLATISNSAPFGTQDTATFRDPWESSSRKSASSHGSRREAGQTSTFRPPTDDFSSSRSRDSSPTDEFVTTSSRSSFEVVKDYRQPSWSGSQEHISGYAGSEENTYPDDNQQKQAYGAFNPTFGTHFDNYQMTAPLTVATKPAPSPAPASTLRPSVQRVRSATSSMLEIVPELPETSTSPPRDSVGGIFRNPFYMTR